MSTSRQHRGHNIIIHPTRHKGIAYVNRFRGRVMMGVIRIQQAVNQKPRMVLGGSTMLE
jgi:hypothetical protein